MAEELSYPTKLRTYSRPAYIELLLAKATNLEQLCDELPIHPFFVIRQSDIEWVSKVGYKEANSHLWGECFRLEISMDRSFSIQLFSKSQDQAPSAQLEIPTSLISSISLGKHSEFSLKFPQKSQSAIDNQSDARLEFSMRLVDPVNRFTVTINKHKVRRETRWTHVVYQLSVKRDDGVTWKVDSRYSQMRRIRERLIQTHPEIGSIPFPGKNYLCFLGCLAPQFSNLSLETVARRKRMLEEFFNAVLLGMDRIRDQGLCSLLNIRPSI